MRTQLVIVFLFLGLSALNAHTESKQDTLHVQHKESKGIIEPIYDYVEKTAFQYLESSNDKTSDIKGFKFSIMGGPYYSNETKVGMGLIGSGLYRVKGCSEDMAPSSVSLFSNITTVGAYSFGVKGTTFFPEMHYWINANVSFSDTPLRYWGIGYDAGSQENYSTYNNMQKNIEVDLFKKTGKYSALGIITNAMEVSGVNFSEVSLLGNESRKTTAVGVGLIASYDSRDFIPNPYKGIYAMASNTYYAGALGSTHGFNKIDLIFRCYKQLRKGTILAFDLDGTFNIGNVNWGMMALVGSPNQMRGYYQGRYRDKKLIDTQVEIRQHVYKRSGVVAWAGAGNAFSKFSTVQLCQTLPTYGAGYRFELKERVNLRLDYGRGKDQSAFYININEAF
ncbi:BamA/TamA family outer membrane protein [Dysgonomonas sp. HDW5B]|uniref:BamA/TamA family outer membrane protein n=1 Tax=Dysgonomonas sp. HDW5B TaxID=2714927 RepID=UPI00140A47D0|nr:BamA/TamA family outer membrane protein [Dysgonomonas sp. HDW5B]QIK55504.1 BamA/TamA family outer membrane protein [Dysgonomonas sp. HDW5B]